MNVVKGASGDVCGVLSAFGEGFLSIATSNWGTPIMRTMTGFCKDCIRTTRRRPSAFSTERIGLGRILKFSLGRQSVPAALVVSRLTALGQLIRHNADDSCNLI